MCVEETRKPYSGSIEGYLYYRDIRPIHEVMFQVKSFIFDNNYEYLDSFPSTPYVKGCVVNGKAEGKWEFYQFQDSILLAESSFLSGKIDGKLIVYDVYNISENRGIASYYRKGKYLYCEVLD
jgi:hypothetical protein